MNIEDLELILHPMVEEAKEAVGSMGDDTPTAVLSNKHRPLSHFFRQNLLKRFKQREKGELPWCNYSSYSTCN